MTKPSRFIVLFLGLSMLTLGLPLGATASKGTPKDPDEAVTYVNAGTGFTACAPTASTPGGVTVYNPATGAKEFSQSLPAQSVDPNDPRNSHDICVNGAIWDWTDKIENQQPGQVSVWIDEEVSQQTSEKREPAGFFQIRSSYEYTDTSVSSPNCEPGTWTEVCENIGEGSETVSYTRVTHKTPMCTNLITIDLDYGALEEPSSVPSHLSHDSNTHAGMVFLDHTYAFDCSEASKIVNEVSRELVDLINSMTCNPDAPLPNVVCITPNPDVSTSCTAPIEDRTLATTGEIAWNNRDLGCSPSVAHDSYVFLQGSQTVSVKNFPVQIE